MNIHTHTFLSVFFGICLFVLITGTLSAQQIPNSSHINETKSFWNPAATAPGTDMITDGFFRMQWLGFEGAPFSGMASFQYPLLNLNMSAGVILHYDNTGPVSKVGGKFNYAYKIKEFFGRYDQLSLGISANLQMYSFDPSNTKFNDAGDVALAGSRTSNFFPAAGLGIYYLSSTRVYRENAFYFGLATNQMFTTDVLVNDVDQERINHWHLNAGGKIYNFDMMFEPSITANMVKPSVLDVLYSLKMEMRNAFWAGLGYASSGIMAAQGGIILDKFGSRFGNLRIGVLANYGLLNNLSNLGPGAELYVGYNFDMD
ncbi:MAG: PorP/SprF family type IX secretion system membrane protein [Saprospiraceae bacterium]|nr:PorP/SprF family type IX secretion system membrane protein [Saprospiraceae bacterium]MBK6566656.1 PorP/SprF family type IX secretion system membrane protein [Saprospiraceae bacterium]MBK8370617.1 PorP/SprF family type IX secretion system membrane protein [Saprospiraceae bacterium]MBK8546463.1 PorP/SprF family type IX secretion system membrane protein [Saprospiraceae bacterium]MBK8854531.1 PorP/SprF family type IX secretion system membrane protein [Saprospiraceae bacterium]